MAGDTTLRWMPNTRDVQARVRTHRVIGSSCFTSGADVQLLSMLGRRLIEEASPLLEAAQHAKRSDDATMRRPQIQPGLAGVVPATAAPTADRCRWPIPRATGHRDATRRERFRPPPAIMPSCDPSALTHAHVLTLQAYCDGRSEPPSLCGPQRESVAELRSRIARRVAGTHAVFTVDDVALLNMIVAAMWHEANAVLQDRTARSILRRQAQLRMQLAYALHVVRQALVVTITTAEGRIQPGPPRGLR